MGGLLWDAKDLAPCHICWDCVLLGSLLVTVMRGPCSWLPSCLPVLDPPPPWPSKLDTFLPLLPDVSISSSPDRAIIYQVVSRVVGRGAPGTRVCFVPLLKLGRIIQLSLQPTAGSCWTPGANVKGAVFHLLAATSVFSFQFQFIATVITLHTYIFWTCV